MKYPQGFGLTETLLAILLTAIISSAFFLGITQAKLYLESIRVKQKAFQELKNWTNEWKSVIASGGGESVGSDPSGGVPVTLKENSDGRPVIVGKMHKNITKANESGQYSIYYNIDTFIRWDKTKSFLNTTEDNAEDTIRFNVYQIEFNIQ